LSNAAAAANTSLTIQREPHQNGRNYYSIYRIYLVCIQDRSDDSATYCLLAVCGQNLSPFCIVSLFLSTFVSN